MKLGKEIKSSGFLKEILLDIESFLSPFVLYCSLFFHDCNQILCWIESNYVPEWAALLFMQWQEKGDDFMYFAGVESQQIKTQTGTDF